ncbi:hypothetical protein MY1884_007249, partial [Beauveria asiatica]
SLAISLPDNDAHLCVALTSTVLALRGNHMTAQPLLDQDSGSALCWNGEAWRIHGQPVTGNDGEFVLSKLVTASSHSQEAILNTLRAIEGPFAFVFVDKRNKVLYYGRDRLGRRSLLVKLESPFQLSSISDASTTGWLEVEADGCYSISLTSNSFLSTVEPSRHDWDNNAELISALGIFNVTVPKGLDRLTENAEAVATLKNYLLQSLQYRVQGIPVPPGVNEPQVSVAVLFSGGLDCTVLARLTHELLPKDDQVDLLNVAFENPRIAAQHKDLDPEKLFELCPDRMTGRQSHRATDYNAEHTLQVNVPYSDTTFHRNTVVSLIYPHNTEMDLSIAFALYFAARGQGLAQTSIDAEPVPYSTEARVLLSGLGADELFGGYSRHGIAFERKGYEGLIEELRLDVGRLGKRNLGRDDRAMSHWGREARFPFLDEGLVKWAIELPVWQKCDFGNDADGEKGVEASKRILRLLARDLGLQAVSMEKKRACVFLSLCLASRPRSRPPPGSCTGGARLLHAWPSPALDLFASVDANLAAFCAASPVKICRYDAAHEFCRAGLNTITFVAEAEIGYELEKLGSSAAIDVAGNVSAALKAVSAGLHGLYLEKVEDGVALFNSKAYGLQVLDAEIEAGFITRTQLVPIGKGCANHMDIGAQVGAQITGLVDGVCILPSVILVVNQAKVLVSVAVEHLPCVVGNVVKTLVAIFDCHFK